VLFLSKQAVARCFYKFFRRFGIEVVHTLVTGVQEGNGGSPLLVEAERLAVGKLVQGLIKPEGEDEGILVDSWSVAAFGGRIEARQSGQECDAQCVGWWKEAIYLFSRTAEYKAVAEKEKPFLQQALKNGTLQRLFELLTAHPELAAIRRILIDATNVRAHRCAAGAPKKGVCLRAGSWSESGWILDEDCAHCHR
jgi:hypothetical protein